MVFPYIMLFRVLLALSLFGAGFLFGYSREGSGVPSSVSTSTQEHQVTHTETQVQKQVEVQKEIEYRDRIVTHTVTLFPNGVHQDTTRTEQVAEQKEVQKHETRDVQTKKSKETETKTETSTPEAGQSSQYSLSLGYSPGTSVRDWFRVEGYRDWRNYSASVGYRIGGPIWIDASVSGHGATSIGFRLELP